jgi:hypothetical protein
MSNIVTCASVDSLFSQTRGRFVDSRDGESIHVHTHRKAARDDKRPS